MFTVLAQTTIRVIYTTTFIILSFPLKFTVWLTAKATVTNSNQYFELLITIIFSTRLIFATILLYSLIQKSMSSVGYVPEHYR